MACVVLLFTACSSAPDLVPMLAANSWEQAGGVVRITFDAPTEGASTGAGRLKQEGKSTVSFQYSVDSEAQTLALNLGDGTRVDFDLLVTESSMILSNATPGSYDWLNGVYETTWVKIY